jgi:hypothetical protein
MALIEFDLSSFNLLGQNISSEGTYMSKFVACGLISVDGPKIFHGDT